MRSFDFRNCVVSRPPLKIGDVLIKCRYPGCEYKSTDILIKNHEKDCKKATVNEDLMEVLMLPQERPEMVARQRTINTLQNFKEYSNVAQILYQITGEVSTPVDDQESEYYMHMIMDTDTLQGLAIKYGCTVQQIKEINQLRTDTIHERVALKVPQKRQQSVSNDIKLEELQKILEGRLILKFKRKARCTFDEAKYYLEETNMDFSKAFMLFAGDNEWSKSADPPFRPSIPIRRAKKSVIDKSRRECCSLFM
jgi:LysM repeat protein